MDRDTSFLRSVSAAGGIAMILFGCWYSWREFRSRRVFAKRAERMLLVGRLADSLVVPTDSLCQRTASDTLLRPDPLGWLPGAMGLPMRARGRDQTWDWACLQSPDSGIVVFVALDTGCGSYRENGLWSHGCHVMSQVWDLPFDQGSGRRSTSHNRSRWVHPGNSRVCPPGSRPDAPPESTIASLCVRPRTRD